MNASFCKHFAQTDTFVISGTILGVLSVELHDFHGAQVGFGKSQFLVHSAGDGEDWFSRQGLQ